MKYSDYEKKIYSVTKVLRFSYIHRIALILITAAIVGVSATLVGTKGIVFDLFSFKDTYEYGEVDKGNTGAFMGSASFEYSLKGEDKWSEEFPKYIGEYEARAKSNNNFGSHYYGNHRQFRIVKKQVDIKVTSSLITYGDEIKVSTSKLSFNDKLDSYSVSVQNKEEAIWNVTPNVNSIHIKNSDGEDVTDCYEFVSYSSPVQVKKRPITIKSADASKEYDGTPLIDNSFAITAGSLVSGDKVVATPASSASLINISSLNVQTYAIYDSKGLDMTSHYDIDARYGNLVIQKRNISFESQSKSYVYNGNVQGFSTNDIRITEGSLVNNETAVFTTCSQNEFVAASIYENEFDVKILSGDTDISEFYNITKLVGTTTIEPRPITIRSLDSSKVYDGEELSNKNFEITQGSLASKDKIIVSNTPTFVDVGEYQNSLSYSIVDKNTNTDFSSSYIISTVEGSINISKRNISLKLDKVETTYDGQYHSNKLVISSGTLASGDKAVIVSGNSQFHAGTYSNEDVVYDIQNSSNESVLSNYNVSFDQSSCLNSIVISKRNLSIKVLDRSKVYDDKTFTEMGEVDGTNGYSVLSGSLPSSGCDSISFRYLNDSKYYSDVPYAVESELIIYNNYIDPSGRVDVTSDYNIALSNGTFKIDKRPITISTIDCSYQYDREGMIPSHLTTYSATNLVSGHRVVGIETSCDAINVGQYSYVFDYSNARILDANDFDVTNNYDITYINSGKVNILKRDASIYIHGKSKVYDGTPLTSDEYTEVNLLSGDYPVFYGLPSVTHTPQHPLGDYVTNMPESFDILMYDNTVVTSNYNISLTAGDLYILPRPITLTSDSMSKVFDGLPLGESNVTITGGSLANGDYIVFSDIKSETVKHVSQSGKNTFTATIYNPENIDVTLDYDITCIYGILTITPCPITISLMQDDVEYDGLNHAFSSPLITVTTSSSPAYISEGSLPDTYSLKASWESLEPMIDAGTYSSPTSFKPTLVFSSTRDSDIEDEDFAVTYVDCYRTIVTRQIIISSLGGSKEYDGLPFPFGYEVAFGSLAAGHRIEYDEVEGIVAVCEEVENPIGTPHIYDSNNNDVTSNYNISFSYGKVTIYEKN